MTTQQKIIKELEKRPYISVDNLCRHIGAPVKMLAKVKMGLQNIPDKYLKKLEKELNLQ